MGPEGDTTTESLHILILVRLMRVAIFEVESGCTHAQATAAANQAAAESAESIGVARVTTVNELIEIQFKKNDKRLRVKRQLPGGIEFDEADPLERTVGIEFTPRTEITRIRMDSVRRIQGWQPGEFKLNLSIANGSILLRGVNEHALPEGRYGLRLQVEEAKTPAEIHPVA